MVKKNIFCLFVIFLAVIFSSCQTRGTRNFEWGNLKNLGPNINSAGKDEHPTFTKDGKTMYFASVREGGMGEYDLYVSKLENGEWSRAQLLPSPLNTERDEFDPFLAVDGKRLFFASNRDNEDAYWNCDIYFSEWDGKKWSIPKIFDPVFSTPNKPDWGVATPKNFKIFLFSSGREPAKPQSVQIFQSTRRGDKWTLPEPLPEPVNSGGWEATPYITPDGKTLYLNSGRGEKDKKDVDIWKFEFINGKWGNPQIMDGPFLSEKHDYDPCLSPDGKKFYFTSNRDGGFGNSDIYVAEKIFKKR
jgi:hypothetical protein